MVEHVDMVVEDCRKMLSLASAALSKADETYRDTFFQVREKVSQFMYGLVLTLLSFSLISRELSSQQRLR